MIDRTCRALSHGRSMGPFVSSTSFQGLRRPAVDGVDLCCRFGVDSAVPSAVAITRGTIYACPRDNRRRAGVAMPDIAADPRTEFSHVRPSDTNWRSDGLRDFFLYKDLGIAAATHGKVIAQLVRANEAPQRGTGWHRHEASFHIVVMLKGWARFM